MFSRLLSRLIRVMPFPLAVSAILCPFLAGCAAPVNTGQPAVKRINPVPENAQVLFISNRDTGTGRMEIYATDPQGNVTRITNTDEQHFIFGLDPGRRYIVATRGSENLKRLWVLDLQTGEERPVTGAQQHAEGNSISPDGEWIVFWMIAAGEKYSDIYKVKPDGSALVNLTNTPAAHEFDPEWSHNGKMIAFTYNNGQPNRFILKSMKADGTDIKKIYDPPDAVATPRFPPGVYDPSWSPDDTWILAGKPVKFSGSGENGGAGIWHIIKLSVDGKTVKDLTAAGELADSALYFPSYSHDGKQVIMSGRQSPENASQVSLRIIKMDTDGSNVQKLTDATSWAQFPVWLK